MRFIGRPRQGARLAVHGRLIASPHNPALNALRSRLVATGEPRRRYLRHHRKTADLLNAILREEKPWHKPDCYDGRPSGIGHRPADVRPARHIAMQASRVSQAAPGEFRQEREKPQLRNSAPTQTVRHSTGRVPPAHTSTLAPHFASSEQIGDPSNRSPLSCVDLARPWDRLRWWKPGPLSTHLSSHAC